MEAKNQQELNWKMPGARLRQPTGNVVIEIAKINYWFVVKAFKNKISSFCLNFSVKDSSQIKTKGPTKQTFIRRREELEEKLKVDSVMGGIKQADELMELAIKSAFHVKETVYIGFQKLGKVTLNIHEAENIFKRIRLKTDTSSLEVIWDSHSQSNIKRVKSSLNHSYDDARSVQKTLLDDLISKAQLKLQQANEKIELCSKDINSIKKNSACAKTQISSIIAKRNIFSLHLTDAQSMKKQSDSLCKILKRDVVRLEEIIKEIKIFGMPMEVKLLETASQAHQTSGDKLKAYLNAKKIQLIYCAPMIKIL